MSHSLVRLLLVLLLVLRFLLVRVLWVAVLSLLRFIFSSFSFCILTFSLLISFWPFWWPPPPGASTAASVWTHCMCPASRLWCLSRDRERVKERCHAFMRTLFGCFLCGFVSKSPHYFPKRTARSFAENSERKARDSKDEEADPSRERQTGIRGLFCALVLSLSQIELLCSKNPFD